MESLLTPWLLFFLNLLAQLTSVINSQDDNYSLIINNTNNYGDQQSQEQTIKGVTWMHLSLKSRSLYVIASGAERMLNLELKAVEKSLLVRDKSRTPNQPSKRSTTDRISEHLQRISLGRIHLEAKIRSMMDTLGEQNSTSGQRNSANHPATAREKLERIDNELLDLEREFNIQQMQSKAQRRNAVIGHLVLKDLHDVHFGHFVDKSVKLFPCSENNLPAPSAAATSSMFSRISCLKSTSAQSMLTGLVFPSDFALLNGANTFAITQTFDNALMESLIVPGGTCDGVRLPNLLLVSGNQKVEEGETRFANDVTFRRNQEIPNGIIDGLDWKNLLTSTADRLSEVDGNLTIYGRKQFGHQGLKVLDEVNVSNGRINGVDVVDMAENAMTVDGAQALPSSRWNFMDVRLMTTLSATTINGRKMPAGFVVLNRERILDFKLNLTLPSLKAVSLDVRGRINWLHIAKDVMTEDGRQEIFGQKSFAIARMDSIAPLKDCLEQRRHQRASLDFEVHQEFRSLSSASLDKIVVHGNLDVTGSVDGMHWNSFKKDVIWIRPGESGRLSVPDLLFNQLHIDEVTELKGFLNGIRLPELLSFIVTLDWRQIVNGNLVFMRRVTVLGDLEVLGKVEDVQLKHLVTTNGRHLKKIDRKSFDSLEVRDLWVKGLLCGVSVADWRRRALEFVAGDLHKQEPLDLDEHPFDEIVEKCEGVGEPLRLDANLVLDKVPPIETNLDVDVNVIAADKAPPCRSLDSLKSTLRQIPLQLDEFALEDTISGRLLCTVHSPMDNRTVTVVSLKYLRSKHYAMLVETTRLFDRVTSTELPIAVVGTVRSCHAFNPSSADRDQLILVLDIAENSNFRILVWSPSSNKYISFEEQFEDLTVVPGGSSWRILLATQRRTKDGRQYSRVHTEVTVLTWSTHSNSFVERQSLKQPYPLVQARFVGFSKRLAVSSAVDRETSLVTLYKFDLVQAMFLAIASMIERVDSATLVAGRHLNQTVLLFLTAHGNLVTIVEARNMVKDKERSTLMTDRNVFVSKTAFKLFLLHFSWDRSLVAVVEEHFVTFYNYEGFIELGKMELRHVSNMFSLAAGDFNGDYLFLQTKGEEGYNFGTLSVYQRPNLADVLEDCICDKDIIGLPSTTEAPKMTPFDRLFCRGPDCHGAGSVPASPIYELGPLDLHTEASKAGKFDKPAVDGSCDDQVEGATVPTQLLHEEDIDEATTVTILDEADMVFTEVASTDWILGDDVLAAFTSMSPVVGLQDDHQQDHQLSTVYDHDDDEREDMAASTVSETFQKIDEDVHGPPSTMTIFEGQEEPLEDDAASTQVDDVAEETKIRHDDWTTEQGVDSRHEHFEFFPITTEAFDHREELRPDNLDLPAYSTEADPILHRELDSIGLLSTVDVAEAEEKAFGQASTVLSVDDDVIYDAEDALQLSTPTLVARFWKEKSFSGFPSTISALLLQEEESGDFASSTATEHHFKDVVMHDLSTVSLPDRRHQESETVELSTAHDSDEEAESLYLKSSSPTEHQRQRPGERFAEMSTSLDQLVEPRDSYVGLSTPLDRLIEPQDAHVEMSTMMDVPKELYHENLDNLLESSKRSSEQLPEEDLAEYWPSTPLSAERITGAHEIVEISTVSRAQLPEEQLDDFQTLMSTEAFEDGRLLDQHSHLPSTASTVSDLTLGSHEEEQFDSFPTLEDIESIQDSAESAETSTLAVQKLFSRGPHIVEVSTVSDAEMSEEEEFQVVRFSTVSSSEVELEGDISTMSTDLIGKEDGYAVETSTESSLKQSGLVSLDSSTQTIDSPTSAKEFSQGRLSTASYEALQVEQREHSVMSTIAFPEEDDELDAALQASSTSSPHPDVFPRMNPTDQVLVDCRHRPDIDDQSGPLDLFTEASKAKKVHPEPPIGRGGSCDEQDVQGVTVVPVLIDDDEAAPTTSRLQHGSDEVEVFAEDEMTTNFVWPGDVERAAAASLFEASTLMVDAAGLPEEEDQLFNHLSTVRDRAIDVSSMDEQTEIVVSTEVQEILQKIDDVQIPAASTIMSFGLQEVESVEPSDADSSTRLTVGDDIEIELLSTVASILDEDFKTVTAAASSTTSGMSEDIILAYSTITSAVRSVQIDEDVLEASSERVGVDQLDVESHFSTWRSIISRTRDEQEAEIFFDTTTTMPDDLVGRETSVEVSTQRDDKDEEFAETAAEASTDRAYAKESFEALHDVSTIGGLDDKKDAEDFIESFSTALDIIDGPTPESIDAISTTSDDSLRMDSVRRPEPFSTVDTNAIDSQEFSEASTMGESRRRDVEDVLEASTMSFRSSEEHRLELLDVSTVAETVDKEFPIRPESSSTASLVEEDVVDEAEAITQDLAYTMSPVVQERLEASPIWSTQRLQEQPDFGEDEWRSTESSDFLKDDDEDFFQASTVSSEIRPSEIQRPFQFSSTAMPDIDDGVDEEETSTLQAPMEQVDRIQVEQSTLSHPESLEKDVRDESSTVRLSLDVQEDVAEFSTSHQVREDDDTEQTSLDASTSHDEVQHFIEAFDVSTVSEIGVKEGEMQGRTHLSTLAAEILEEDDIFMATSTTAYHKDEPSIEASTTFERVETIRRLLPEVASTMRTVAIDEEALDGEFAESTTDYPRFAADLQDVEEDNEEMSTHVDETDDQGLDGDFQESATILEPLVSEQPDIAEEFSTIRTDEQEDEELEVELSTAGIVGIEQLPEDQKASTILEVHLGFTDVSEEPEVLELSTRAAHLPDDKDIEPLQRSTTMTYLHVLEDDDGEHFAPSTTSDVHLAEESLVELPATVVAVHQDCGEQQVVTTTKKSDDKVDDVVLVGDAAKGFKDDQEGLGVNTSRPLLVPEIQGAIDCDSLVQWNDETKRLCGIEDTSKLESYDSKLEEKEKDDVQGCRHDEQLSGTVPTVDHDTIRVVPDDDGCDDSSTDESMTTPARVDELDTVDDGELSTVVWTTAFDDDQEPTLKDEQRKSTVIMSTTDFYDDDAAGHDCGT